VRDRRELLDNGLAMLDAMARAASERGWGLDLTLLPETFAWAAGTSVRETAEPIDGPTVTAVAEKARAYGTYAAVPLYLRDGETIHNSVVLLDRSGEPVGAYHKAFPVVVPDGSLEGGTTPGSSFPVFELDFGRVGVQICFDVMYEDGWGALAAQEAELVLMPSAGGSTVSAIASHAYRHGYYVAAASYRAPAVIVNPLGREIARAPEDRDVAVVRVDLDYRLLPSRFIWTRGKEITAKYGDRVDFGWHDAEGYCMLTSRDPELPIGRLVQEEELETLREFLERNRQVQEAARGGPPGGVLDAAHAADPAAIATG
jgi:predicted amidohydrolase